MLHYSFLPQSCAKWPKLAKDITPGLYSFEIAAYTIAFLLLLASKNTGTTWAISVFFATALVYRLAIHTHAMVRLSRLSRLAHKKHYLLCCTCGYTMNSENDNFPCPECGHLWRKTEAETCWKAYVQQKHPSRQVRKNLKNCSHDTAVRHC